jgi:hypothetical protein
MSPPAVREQKGSAGLLPLFSAVSRDCIHICASLQHCVIILYNILQIVRPGLRCSHRKQAATHLQSQHCGSHALFCSRTTATQYSLTLALLLIVLYKAMDNLV